MNRPVIGITAYVERASWGRWVDVPGALVPHRYVRKVEDAGAIALVIPPRADADDATARALLERLDGVVLAGGVDVAPELYADERHPSVQVSRPDRDTTELAIARVAAELDLPLLGHLPGHAGHGGRGAGGSSSSTFPTASATTTTRPPPPSTATTRCTPWPARAWRRSSGQRSTCRATTTSRC